MRRPEVKTGASTSHRFRICESTLTTLFDGLGRVDYTLLDELLNDFDMKQTVSMVRRLRRAADETRKTAVPVLQGPPAEIMRAEAIRAIYDLEATVHGIGGDRIAVCHR